MQQVVLFLTDVRVLKRREGITIACCVITQEIAVQFKDFLISKILNMSFLGSGFLKNIKRKNPQNINKFKYLMNVWVTISTNIQSDYTQVIQGEHKVFP
jgi:hypothetical protein